MTTHEETTAVQVVTQEANLSLKQVSDRVNLVHQVLDKVMKKNTHYGTVPGCGSKMVLLKPGADVLAMTFKLVPRFTMARTDLPNGHREYEVTCSMYGPDGTLLGQGVGSASTMEKKYRYRYDGNGGKIENEDIADVYNTVLKMAKKRAHVDATLTVTGAADIFTQDLIEEDGEGAEPRKPVAMPTLKDSFPDAIQGIVENVVEKSGTGKKGEWTKYGVLIGQDWYGTFDVGMGTLAKELKGKPVQFTFAEDGKYKNLTGIAPVAVAEDVPPSASDPSGPTDDEGRPLKP